MSSDTPYDPDVNPDLTKLTLIPEAVEAPNAQPLKQHAVAPKPPITARPTPKQIAHDPDGVSNRHPFDGGPWR